MDNYTATEESYKKGYEKGKQDAMKWIPVTERLPEISALDKEWSKTVLFRTTQGYIFSGYRCVGRPQKSFYDDDWTPPYWLNESEELEFEDDEVTHWMPLPEPPKGD